MNQGIFEQSSMTAVNTPNGKMAHVTFVKEGSGNQHFPAQFGCQMPMEEAREWIGKRVTITLDPVEE